MSISDDGIPLTRASLLNGADGGATLAPAEPLPADGGGENLVIGSRFTGPTDGGLVFPGPVFTLNPVIDDLQPRSGAPGTPVIILGRNFTPFEGVVRFNGVVSSYNASSTTRIDTVVPNNASTGPVSVDGFNSPFNFTVLAPSPAPTIQGFSPAAGRVGDVINVTGTNLDKVTEARFNGVRSDGIFAFSANILQASVPAGATTGPISVSGPSGSATSAGSFVVATGFPGITSFSPAAGAPGAQVDIFGTELGSANRVTFNGVDAQFTVVGTTQVRAFVPGFVGSGPIRVHTPLGTAVSATNFFAGSGLPTLTSFTPTSGRPGDIVTLNGTDLNLATGVRIGTFRIQVISRPSNQQITFTLPAGVMTGPVILESAAGEVQGSVFTVLPPLTTTVSGISPTQGIAGIGVFISGTALDRVTGGSFAPGIPVQLNPTGDGRLATTVPNGAVTGPITLNTPTGPVFTPVFTVIPSDLPPNVIVLSPGAGQAFSTGQVINVVWSAGDDGTIVSQDIRYSANGGATFQTLVPGLPGATRDLLVQLPAQATESAVIAVRATDNTGKTGEGRSGTFRVGTPVDGRPQVTVLSPNGGEQLVAGQVTRISWNSSDDRGLVSHDVRVSTNGGQTFQDIALGLAGSARETFWAVPDQPTTTALVMVTARDTAGQTAEDRSNTFFRIISLAPPQVQGVAPGEGPLAGGTTVTVTGTGFKPGCRARFGGVDAVTTFVDAGRLSAVTPRGAAAGLVAVAVVNPDGGSGTLGNAFRYLPPSGEPVTGRLVLQSVTVVDPDGDPDAGVPDEDGFDPTAGPALLAVGESAIDSSEAQETALLAVETIPSAPAAIAPAVSVDVGSSLAISRPLGLTDATLSALADVGGLVLVPATAAAEPPPVPRIRAGEVARFAFVAELYDAEGKPVFGRELRITTGGAPPASTLVVAPEFVPSFGTFVATLTTTIETPPARYVLSFQGGTVLQPTLLTPIFVQPIDVELPLRKVRVFASPARQEVAPGGSATFDITLRRKNIPGVPVRPQVKNALPPGVTVTFDPVRITGRMGKMIVQTPPDIGAGDIKVVVTAKVNLEGTRAIPADPVFVAVKPAPAPAGGRLEIGQVTVTDPEPELGPIEPAVEPILIAVPAGGTVAFPVLALLFTGAGTPVDDDVQFRIEGVPPGAVAGIIPNPGRTFVPSVVTVATTRLTPVGKYTLKITGDSLGIPGLTYGPIEVPLEVKPRIRKVEIVAKTAEARVAPGQTAAFDLTLNRTGFNNKPVQLLVDPASLPAGAAASFEPAAPTGNTSVLRIATQSTTPAGTYTVSIGGKTDVDGVEIKGTTVRLIVDAAPVTRTVKLAVTPTAVTLRPGASAKFAVRLNRTNAADVAVALKAQGNLPVGTLFAFTPMRTTTTASTLLVTLPATARPGAYTFQVQGTTTTAGVTIEPSLPVAVAVDLVT